MIDKEPVAAKNLKLWYNDPSMIGKHFLVYSIQNPSVKRHYTICSTMNPKIEAELLSMADSLIAGDQMIVVENLRKTQDQNKLNLTLKTYNTRRGLATRIHKTQIDEANDSDEEDKGKIREYTDEEFSAENAYYIKGPMGKGLQIQHNGIHVAFCAGTGALVFLDLVSHILIKNCYEKYDTKLPTEMASMYQHDFQFHLYFSAQDEENAIGLNVIKKLQEVNEKFGFNNFKAVVRLSVTNGPKLERWTPEYIKKELEPLAG